MGILRSATGARLYARKYNTRCAGTYEEALIQVTPLLLEWADEIVFVNEENYNAVVRDEELNPLLEARPFKVLDIPDEFEHMHPALIDAFEQQYEVLG
ncbi:phosphotyrosine protein phosphatase [Alcaligenes phage vB_Af_QDWS535]|nr:phosphotyrosine protein phosphatase [Alcaligenes phage vB_Af_QDWS535]